MKKFCCSYWESIINGIQKDERTEIVATESISDGLQKLIVSVIDQWPNYCPSCGLSLTASPEAITSEKSKAQSTHIISCKSCGGNGHAGGAKDSTATCTTCLGTGKITINKNVGDQLAKIEDLKNKIRQENKPVRTDENE